MSIRIDKSKGNYHNQNRTQLSKDVLSLLYQAQDIIKKDGSEKNILQTLTLAIQAITTLLKPYLKEQPQQSLPVDKRYMN